MAKASSPIVLDSAQRSQAGASSDSDLYNLKNLASKIEEENKITQSLLKEIYNSMDAMKGQGRELAEVQEGMVIM